MLPPPPPPSDQLGPYLVEVRRPVHIKTPLAQYRHRLTKWRANAAKRGADVTDLPEMALGLAALVLLAPQLIWVFPHRLERALESMVFDSPVRVVALAAIVALAPWVFLGVALLLDVLIWVVAIAVGFITVLVFRRPYRVVVVSRSNVGSVVAEVGVRGKKRADLHAGVVEKRLFAGIDPFDAVRVDLSLIHI